MKHIVWPGETLWRIARQHNMTVAALLALNPEIENADLIRVGHALEIEPGAGAFVLPLEHGRVTWPFLAMYGVGAYAGTYHPGVDLHEERGAKLRAIGDGIVRWARENKAGYGHYVVVEHRAITNEIAEQVARGEEIDVCSFAVFSLYAHCIAGTTLEVGMIVKVGDTVGLEGKSGNAWGEHVHLEIKKTFEFALQRLLTTEAAVEKYFYDPLAFLRAHRFVPVDAWY